MHFVYLCTTLPILGFLAFSWKRSNFPNLLIKYALVVLTGFGLLILLKDLHIL